MALSNNSDTVDQLKSGKLVVRVDQDSDSDLQALFDSVLKPDSKRPLQVPLRMRKLPNSFFNPPSTGSKSPSISHSRENSADSAFGSSGGNGGDVTTGTTSGSGAVNNNTTSNSSSGSGSVTTSATGLQVTHARAHSSPASLQQTYAVGQTGAGSSAAGSGTQGVHHIKQRSYDIVSSVAEELGPLPPGWEQARTPEGQIYYLNHLTRTTTWEDPRKTLAAQAAVPLAAAQHQSTEQLLGTPQQQQQQHTTQSPASIVGNKQQTSTDALGPLPDGWEQAATPEGEIYFINHQTRTTSWFDPRIPVHLQRNPAAGGMLPNNWLNINALQTQDQNSLQASQQKLRLQSLKLEREMLKQRQQEIRRQQELMLRQPSSDLPMDPFLSGLADHSRQESADSGLGMGPTYSMPHTPEDFLANIDDNMDCVSEGVGGGLEAPDLSSLNDSIDNTDDLVPSLQLGEEFSSEILLDDVQSLINPTTKPDNNVLTWL